MLTVLNLIRVIRPHNVAAAVFSTAVGYYMAVSGAVPWLLLSSVAAATAGGNVINDIHDRDIDRINKPGRPFPSGALSLTAGWIVYAVLAATTLILAVRLPFGQSIWVLAWVVLLHLYSARVKRMYLLGNVLVSAVSSSGFLLGALAAGSLGKGLIPACFTFFFVMGREFVKDTEDVRGDRACGARTVPIVSGASVALKTAGAIFALLAIAFPLPSVLGVYGKLYGMIMSLTVIPILLASLYLTWRARALNLVSSLLKVGMFCGMIAFYFGPNRPGGW
jgi:geranylgeranylglycerol-phosphate geranylgeranyltransferase